MTRGHETGCIYYGVRSALPAWMSLSEMELSSDALLVVWSS